MNQISEVYQNLTEKKHGSRSTILAGLIWLTGLLIGTFITTLSLKAPSWVWMTFMIMAIIVACIFLFIYLFCFFKNPDLLRSEKYSIEKLVIEKSFIGSNETGLMEQKNLDPPNLSKQIEE